MDETSDSKEMSSDPKPERRASPRTGRKAAAASVVGAIPLVISLVAASVLPSRSGKPSAIALKHGITAVKCDTDIEDFNACHADYPTGCSNAARYDPDLNLLKNKLTHPSADSAPLLNERDCKKLENGLPADLSKSNRKQFASQLKDLGEGEIRGIVAYLYYAKLSGAESVNCLLTGEENADFHIGIGFDPEIAKALRNSRKLSPDQRRALTQTSMIVEMTPHFRAFFEPNWTLDALKSSVGEMVKVTGQLLVDNEHIDPSQNCRFSPDPPVSCWRASAWELHPVSSFLVCDRQDSACDEASTDWVELGQPQEKTVARAGKSK